MSSIGYITLLLAPVVLALLIAVMRSATGVAVALLAGWLFLPQGGFSIPGIPDYTKMSATSLGLLLGCLATRPTWVIGWRPSLIDVPALMFVVSPFLSSMANGLGAYDGGSATFARMLTWGIPYVVGRGVFRDVRSCSVLAKAMVVAGLVYVPLCLYEIRMSPQLHQQVFGFSPRGWGGSRLGGWRPQVFLDTGLALGMWMTAATLVAVWLWRSRALKPVLGVPPGAIVGVLVPVTVLCKSLGALALLVMGLLVYELWRVTRWRVVLIVPAIAAVAYMGARVPGVWHGEPIPQLAAMVDEGRAASFEFRLRNEDILIDKAMREPWIGWGGWGRSRVYNEYGQDISVTDGLWVIVLGQNGLFGLIGLYGMMLLPGAAVMLRAGRGASMAQWAAPTALAMVCFLWSIDNLLNAMHNPIFIVASGSLASVAGSVVNARGRLRRESIPTHAQGAPA